MAALAFGVNVKVCWVLSALLDLDSRKPVSIQALMIATWSAGSGGDFGGMRAASSLFVIAWYRMLAAGRPAFTTAPALPPAINVA